MTFLINPNIGHCSLISYFPYLLTVYFQLHKRKNGAFLPLRLLSWFSAFYGPVYFISLQKSLQGEPASHLLLIIRQLSGVEKVRRFQTETGRQPAGLNSCFFLLIISVSIGVNEFIPEKRQR
ncbi:hypothetical protein C6Y45_06345 [Alkalicoccus saliphilus]|uniref:Uncharacterized protein n=1 Tax=Alkalicoccus saliphilus TaxID=200989 RepID=A0A2T4U7U4_9BACI|nr:hypothetical protein C6Y45_06345 [Alkalicoccus saliphilus]